MDNDHRKSPVSMKPLKIGRIARVVFGVFTLLLIWMIGTESLGLWGTIGLAFLGISFLAGGLMGNPGCELTALPNLVLPGAMRIHCL